jgi:hypothetical protein
MAAACYGVTAVIAFCVWVWPTANSVVGGLSLVLSFLSIFRIVGARMGQRCEEQVQAPLPTVPDNDIISEGKLLIDICEGSQLLPLWDEYQWGPHPPPADVLVSLNTLIQLAIQHRHDTTAARTVGGSS